MRLSIFVTLAFSFALSSSAPAADWGHLKMRFVYDGEPPRPKVINRKFLGPLLDESLLINEQDRGVKNVCVWVLPTGDQPLPVHPDYDKPAANKISMTIRAGILTPRIGIIRTTQTLVVANAEAFGYNVKVDPFNNEPFNVLLAAGNSFECRFAAPERTPTALSCSIHPWLNGYLFIRDNPYAALSNERGQLMIKSLPAGDWTFVMWHELTGFMKKAAREATPVDLQRGRVALIITSGDNDLGEIKLAPEQFKR
jgi:hypothetical protein